MKKFEYMHLVLGGQLDPIVKLSPGAHADLYLDAANSAIGWACLCSWSKLVIPCTSIPGQLLTVAQLCLTALAAMNATEAFVSYYHHFSAAQSSSKEICL